MYVYSIHFRDVKNIGDERDLAELLIQPEHLSMNLTRKHGQHQRRGARKMREDAVLAIPQRP